MQRACQHSTFKFESQKTQKTNNCEVRRQKNLVEWLRRELCVDKSENI